MAIVSASILAGVLAVIAIVHTQAASVEWIVTTSDKSKQFVRESDLSTQSGTSNVNQQFTLTPSQEFQNMYGYGAALTQSSAYLLTNYKAQNANNYWRLLNRLFNQSSLPTSTGDESIAMNVLRYPMGASDFILPSIHYFSYDDTYWDYALSHLSLSNAESYQIPVLLDILRINPQLKVMLCPWSAPTWLKTSSASAYPQNWESGSFNGSANNYAVYAQYFVDTLNLYASLHGIRFWALSMQNEPLNCPNSWAVMCLSAQQEIQFLNVLAPLLRSSALHYGPPPKVMIYDHNWDNTQYAHTVLSDATAYANTDFTAWHCYGGSVSAQSVIHDAFPDKEMIFTECSGTGKDNFAANLAWNAHNLWLGSVQNWASLVTHWNLVLDQNYNPHNGGCANCRGTFELDSDSQYALTYFEEFFGIGHYGKWVDAQYPAKRIQSKMSGDNNGCVSGLAFKNAAQAQLSNRLIIVVNNFCNSNVMVGVQQGNNYFNVEVPVGISSFLW